MIGFGTQALILPQIDSLFAFTILFAAVTAIGAWVGTSGPRMAYAGAQIVLAYDLVNLNRFTITTSLIPARDTVLGIMLGIFSMWLIFDHLWPTSSTDSMRVLFLSTVEELAALDVPIGPLSMKAQLHYLLSTGDRINTQLDRLRNLVDFSVFEPYSQSANDEYLTECIRTLQPQLRCFLLMKTGLLEHRLTSKTAGEEGLLSAVQHRSSDILRATAQTIESGAPLRQMRPEDLAELASSVMATLAHARTAGLADLMVQMQLSASLLDLARDIRIEWQNLAHSYKQQPQPVCVV